jgi:hypothetical protein
LPNSSIGGPPVLKQHRKGREVEKMNEGNKEVNTTVRNKERREEICKEYVN